MPSRRPLLPESQSPIILGMLSVKISTKHQIAVPSEARKKLGLKAGDRLDVEIEGDVIHLRRHVPAGTRLMGIGAHVHDGTDPAERIRALRDEWEARQLEREAQVARDIAAAWAAARAVTRDDRESR
jgi:AbrB family looped-hinge helix DNA binding protein